MRNVGQVKNEIPGSEIGFEGYRDIKQEGNQQDNLMTVLVDGIHQSFLVIWEI